MEKDGFKEFGKKDEEIEVVVDVRACGLVLSEGKRMIQEDSEANPSTDEC